MGSRRKQMGSLGGLEVTANRGVLGSTAVLALVLTVVARNLFRLTPAQAITGGVVAAALHVLSELWHQRGHAQAAQRTGYPMEGIDLYGVLGQSRYPADEPPLPGSIHVQRALGGPRASALLTAAAALLALIIRPGRTLGGFLSLFLAADNLAIFTLGALLPNPFIETDGEVLLREIRRRRPHNIVIQE